MDTILLVIGVVGLSISGWVLRGYFVRPTSSGAAEPLNDNDEEETFLQESASAEPVQYVSSQEHQKVLNRLEQLEKMGLVPQLAQNGSQPSVQTPGLESTGPGLETLPAAAPNSSPEGEGTLINRWEEIFALQEDYKRQREKEAETDYEREQTLFDLSQGYDGLQTGPASEEDLIDQRLLDNQMEEGISVDDYQERMSTFATLSREMLVMRLEAADTQLREQQLSHQKSLLTIIASLIEKMPGDTNLKSVAQASFVAASTEISNADGQTNRENFQKMFYEQFGYKG